MPPAAPNVTSSSPRWKSSPPGTGTLSSWRLAQRRAVVHADRLDLLTQDGKTERLAGAERAAELTRETWRAFEEFNLSPPLALEALFVKLRRELGAIPILA